MRKKNMKWKKLGSIENVKEGCNTWFTGKAIKMNTTNG